MPESYTLKIRDLSLQVHLGCTVAEQEHTQEVCVSAEIRFRDPPGACTSDRLDDTICYAQICEAFRVFCQINAFRTVERLGQSFFDILKREAHMAESLRISLHKVNPPVDSLLGGIVFEISEDRWR